MTSGVKDALVTVASLEIRYCISFDHWNYETVPRKRPHRSKKIFFDSIFFVYHVIVASQKMTSVSRVFYSKINFSEDKATRVVLVAVVLHNMFRIRHTNTYTWG